MFNWLKKDKDRKQIDQYKSFLRRKEEKAKRNQWKIKMMARATQEIEQENNE